MRKVKLQNVFWEEALNEFIETDKVKMGVKSRSAALRIILKQRYKICQVYGCASPAIYGEFCQYHGDSR